MSQNLKGNHWTKESKCQFDSKLLSFLQEEIDEVKRMCATCPVIADCKNWVEEIDGHFTAAGMTRYDRLLSRWRRAEDLNESNFK